MRDGTLVYSPDIRVYVSDRESGEVYDLSQDIEDFTLTRGVSRISTFTCTLNNKYRRYDRKLQRMARVKVWLRRTAWLQCFSGYLDIVPYETVVPGSVSISASCTLKRLEHTYWDQYTDKAQVLLPHAGTWGSEESDGGASKAIFNVITQVAAWNKDTVHIQRIPEAFLAYSDTIYNQVKTSIDNEAATNLRQYLESTVPTTASTSQPETVFPGGAKPLDTQGHTFPTPHMAHHGTQLEGWDCALPVGMDIPEDTPENKAKRAAEQAFWAHKKVLVINREKSTLKVVCQIKFVEGSENGIDLSNDALSALGGPGGSMSDGAAVDVSPVDDSVELGVFTGNSSSSGGDPAKDPGKPGDFDISKISISAGDHPDVEGTKPGAKALAMWLDAFCKANNFKYRITSGFRPGGTSFHAKGWALDIVVGSDANGFFDSAEVDRLYQMLQPYAMAGAFGELIWKHDIWHGTGKEPYPGIDHFNHMHIATNSDDTFQGSSVAVSPTSGGGGAGAGGPFSDGSGEDGLADGFGGAGRSPFAIAWGEWPTYPLESEDLTGSRAWINDTKVLETVGWLAKASLREYQSAPNGDFIAWFPDWLGVWGKTPAMEIRDIELRDWKMTINDSSLVTHVAAIGNAATPGSQVSLWDKIFTYGLVTIENEALLGLLFGSTPGLIRDPRKFLATFGIRPQVESVERITSHRWEFLYALFKFMKGWAQQYNSVVSPTFMPELYPGMRARLTDHDIEVYIGGVTHSGSRTGGFSTTVEASCPMRNGHLLELELTEGEPIVPANSPNQGPNLITRLANLGSDMWPGEP